MVHVRFTRNIQRHVECPDAEVAGATVRAALDAYFTGRDARARGYVLDEQGAVRPHMNVFVDGRPVSDRASLADPVGPGGTIDVMQALSGG